LQLPIGSLAQFRYYQNMAKWSREKVIPKKPGRPATGRDPVFALRLPNTLRSAIEGWANRQKDKPSRSEAIRRLIELNLKVSKGGRHQELLTVSIRQVKAARALLGWSQEQLAAAAEVSTPTIKRLEAQDGPMGGRSETGAKIRAALEVAGVEFIDENGGGPGVRLRKQEQKKAEP
jgi:ribosome-binding protein aMBF1 (putative translation factor)